MNGGYEMDRRRALEIAASPDMKNVTHNGNRVFIQHVNEENHTARIYPLDDPGNEFEVQLESLHEVTE